MGIGILSAAYLVASVLFILSLGGLSNQEKAKRAVWYGIFGMGIAIIATIFGPGFSTVSYILLIPLLAIGALIGKSVAQRVEMTEMPQLVAALHSFVGLAAVFIGLNSAMQDLHHLTGAEIVIHEVEIFLGVFIGAITFTGSIVAYAKLAGRVNGKALILPGRHILNSIAVVASLILLVMYINSSQLWTLYAMLFIALLVGAHLVIDLTSPRGFLMFKRFNCTEVVRDHTHAQGPAGPARPAGPVFCVAISPAAAPEGASGGDVAFVPTPPIAPPPRAESALSPSITTNRDRATAT